MSRIAPAPGWLADPAGPYLVQHDLDTERAFSIPDLAALARQAVDSAVPSGATDDTANPSPSRVIAAIPHHPGWAVLRDECWEGAPRSVLDQAVHSIRAWSADHDPGTYEVDRSVIVTSAGAVTRLHLDVDESYLLQVHGTKTVCFLPPSVLPAAAITDVHRAQGRQLSVTREQALAMRKFVIGPGQGVHVPYGWPHATRVGADYSISVSLAFQTDRTIRLRAEALSATLGTH